MKNLLSDPKITSVKIIPSQKGKLEKEHLQFNKLCNSIEKLQGEIESAQIKYQNILDYYLLNYRPGLLTFSEYQFEMIELLDRRSQEIKLSKRQNEILGFTISQIFDEAIGLIQPDEKCIEIFNRWNPDHTFNERLEYEKEEMKEDLSSLIWETLGLDIDPDEIDDSEESMKNLEEKVKEHIDQHNSRFTSGKKSKKATDKIQLQKTKEELKEKSIRKIYLALAKILHPDAHMNEEEKLEREQVMKQVNIANENKDFYTLLKLEIEWMNKNQESLADNYTLKLYIEVLNDQISDLRQKKQFIKMDPRWHEINIWLNYTEKNAKYRIDYDKMMQERKLKLHAAQLNELKNVSNPRHFIIAMIKEFEPAYSAQSDFGFW